MQPINAELIIRNPLFESFNPEDMEAILKCISAHVKKYDRDQIIFMAGDKIESVGLILQGSVQLIKEDVWGNRNIVAHLEQGGLIGEALVCAGIIESPVTAICTENTTVLYLNFKRVLNFCSNACAFHSKLIENLLKVLAKNSLLISEKLDIISMRTTREKLYQYLLTQFREQKKNPFNVPLNRNQLADYLCVERSAMSRELSKMKAEGIIDYKKHDFTLLDLDENE